MFPVIGTSVIDSAPPATTTSYDPIAIAPAAYAIACSPLEQKRLIVTPPVSIGKPPRSPADAREVEPLLPFGHRAPEDEILHVRRLHLRHPRHQRADHLAGHLVRALQRERPLVRAPDRGTNRLHNHDFFHGVLLKCRPSRALLGLAVRCRPGR